ncbi:MAG TPA: hypothetical protein VGB77_10975 [Abditibacteriaceae bacterium]|jgi:hypothetical protein
MTIGDVLAVVGVISGVCLSLWVLLIGVALLFEAKANAARRVLENEAGRAFGLGLLTVLPLGFGSIALLNAPGAFKFLGWILLLVLLATSLLGGSGMALLMGERTGARDERISSLTALARGAGMMSLAWLFPVLGWFLIAPASVIAGLGAGAKVLWKRGAKARKPSPLSPVQLSEPFPVTSQITPQPVISQTALSTRLKDEESCESPGAIGSNSAH